MIHNIISVSGGKDSTATLLLAIDRGVENMSCVFADTGNEHPITYDYLDYLEQRLDLRIQRVSPDFSDRIAKKRGVVETKWRREEIPEEVIQAALEVLQPTGNAFLDMCIWKGRFPSSRVRFCTDELKIMPIQEQVIFPLLKDPEAMIESWQGIRWDESKARSSALEREGVEPDALRVFAYRPILTWTADDVFAFHRKHNVSHNPLYELGMGRVGCMPCVNARKGELKEIAKRFPEVIERIREWERVVSLSSKLGSATFFCSTNDPTVIATDAMAHDTHGIDRMVDWANTTRGGRQRDLMEFMEPEAPSCSSIYGLCE